jgi:hypothetical protein
VVNASGVIYRRGVSTSLTQIFDERQLDFLPSYGLVFDLIRACEDSTLFWPKAARQFCAIACHHLGREESWPEELRPRLRAGITGALAELPRNVRADALEDLDGERRTALQPLLPGGSGRSSGSAVPAGVLP